MAYAAVLSLKQTINRLLNHSNSTILLPNSEMKSINEDLCSLQSILQTISSVQISERVDNLQGQIRDLSHELEDLIDHHTLSDRILSESESSVAEGLALSFFQKLLKAKDEFSSFTQMLKAEGERNGEGEQLIDSLAAVFDAVSLEIDHGETNVMVGVDKELRQLKDWLLQDTKKLDVISIFGMAGIGKTSFAKVINSDELVKWKFNPRLFMTIGPKYELKEFLLGLVGRMGVQIDGISKLKDKEVGLHVYQFLIGRRYLIALDDVWSIHIWNEVRQFFPDQGKGCRIILTTRNRDVAHLASTSRHFLEVPFLDEHPSWELLHRMIFPNGETCSAQLEKVGKRIVKKCDGLPMAIVSAANFLCEGDKTVENWSRIAENDISGIISVDDYTNMSEALSLSYKQLPPHLKACFLYMGVFPRNYEIPTSKLLKLWVVEGLLEPKMNKTPEEMARECLDDLVSRCLVLVHERSSRGRPKTCRVHFLIRNLCVTEAEKEKFFCILNNHVNSSMEGAKSQRRLCIHNNILFALKEVHSSMQSVSAARSLLCVGPEHRHPLRVCLRFKLLKVLDALSVHFYRFPHQVLELGQLKYLAITYDGELPASISGLWNLEVLIVHQHHSLKPSDAPPVYLPREIWKLRMLKHLECLGFDLPDPSINGDGSDDSLVLEKLLTLSGVSVHSCTHGVFARTPNLLKLRIWIGSTHDAVKTFNFFGAFTEICHNLESFNCIVMNRGLANQVVSPIPAFPLYLKKLTLSRCGFSWEYMANIGRLPNLEVLKLRCCAFRGPMWETDEEQFSELKFMLLEDLDMEEWITNEDHFPKLKHIIIRHCYKLQKIPSDVIEFPAIELIEVDNCSPSAVASARGLQDEIEELCYEIRFRIYSSWRDGMYLTL